MAQLRNTIISGGTGASGAAQIIGIGTTGANYNLLSKDSANLTTFSIKDNGDTSISGNLFVTGNIGFGGFTPGSVLFADSNGLFAQNNSSFFWNNSNNSLIANNNVIGNLSGFGTLSPTSKVTILDTQGYEPSLVANAPAHFNIKRSVSAATDLVFSISQNNPYTASIQHRHSATDNSAYPIALNPLGGNVGVGTINPTQKLDVAGSVQAYGLLVLDGSTVINRDGGYLRVHGSSGIKLTVWNTGYVDALTVQATTGNIGVNTISPNKRFTINDSANAQLRLEYNSTSYSDFQVDTSGNLRITPIGVILSLGDSNNPKRLDINSHLKIYQTGSSPSVENVVAQDAHFIGSTSDTNSQHWTLNIGNKPGTGHVHTANSGGNVRIVGNSSMPAASTSTFYSLELAETINTHSTAAGISGSLRINPALTQLPTGGYRAIEIVPNSASAYGIYQSGSLTKNYFAGNVGIGISNPIWRLHMDGSILISNTTAMEMGSDTIGGIIRTYGTNLRFSDVGGTEYVRFDSTNYRVGIGTSSPAFKLDVRGTGYFSTVSGTPQIVFGDATNGVQSAIGMINNVLSLYPINGGTAAQTILANGNVGIGTVSPTSILDLVVSGGATNGIRFKGWSDAATPYLLSLGTQTYQDNFRVSMVNGNTYLGLMSSYNLFIMTNGQDRITVKNDGNIGIGISPTEKLHVSGNVKTVTSGSALPLSMYQDTYQSFYLRYPSSYVTQLNFGALGIVEYDGSGGRMTIRNSSTQAGTSWMKFVMGSTDVITLTDTFNVGIGKTPHAQAKLDIEGSLRLSGNIVSTGGQLVFNNNFTGSWAAIGSSGLNIGDWYTLPSYGQIRVGDYGFNVMRTDSTSLISVLNTGKARFSQYGIGTFTGTPTYSLYVDATGNIIEIPVDGGPINGSGVANKLAYWSDANTLTSNNTFSLDGTTLTIDNSASNPSKFKVQGAWANVNISGEFIELRKPNYSAGGWARNVFQFAEYDGTVLSGFGFNGTNNTTNYGYIGTAYNNTAIAWRASDNFVGIGTANPNDRLEVVGNIGIGTNKIYNNAANNSAGISFINSAVNIDGYNGIIFNSGQGTIGSQTTRMVITNTGTVGIGVTSLNYKLEVGSVSTPNVTNTLFLGNGSISTAWTVGSKLSFGFSSAISNDDYTARIIGYTNAGVDYASRLFLQTHNATSGIWNSGVMLDEFGNVGIGTTSPGYKLEVTGKIAALETVGGATDTQLLLGTTVNFFNIGRIVSTGYLSIQGTQTGANNILLAPTSGNVGIGTTAPQAKLVVESAGVVSVNINDSSSSQIPTLNFQQGGTTKAFIEGGVDLSSRMDLGVAGSRIMTLINGNVGIGTSSPLSKLHVNTSTSNLRTSIVDILTLESIDSATGYDGYGQGIAFRGRTYMNSTVKTLGRIATTLRDNSVLDRGTAMVFELVTTSSASALAERMRIDYQGNLGIGTTEPLSKLHVNGDIFMPYGAYFRGGTDIAGSNSVLMYNSATGDMEVTLLSQEWYLRLNSRMTIARRLGVGAMSPLVTADFATSTNGPITPLSSVPDSATTMLIGNTGTSGVIAFGQTNSGTSWIQSRSRLANQAAGPLLLNPLGGNVGINTTNPTAKLHIVETTNGADAFKVTNYIGDYVLNNYNFNTPSSFLLKSAGYLLLSSSGNPVYLSSNNGATYMMTINTDGNVGLNTNSPESHFHVSRPSTGVNRIQVTAMYESVFRAGTATDNSDFWYDGSYATTYIDNNYGAARGAGNQYGDIRFRSKLGAGTTISTVMTLRGFNGYVGIGTTTPQAVLHTVGGTSMTGGWNRNTEMEATYPVQVFNSNNLKWAGIGYDHSSAMRFWVNASSRDVTTGANVALSIFNSYNVSIGTMDDLGAKMSIVGANDVLNLRSISGGYHTLTLSTTFGGGNDYAINPAIPGVSNGGFSLYDITNSVNRFVIQYSTGNVGINTTNPTAKLNIVSTGSDFSGLVVQDAARKIKIGRDQIQVTNLSDVETTMYLQPLSNLYVNSTSGFTYFGGNVGIGTTTPGDKLDVRGAISSGDGSLRNVLSYSAGFGVIGTLSNNGTQIWSNSTAIATFLANGNVGIGTTTPESILHIGTSTNTGSDQNLFQIGEPGYPNTYGLVLKGNSVDGVFKIFGINNDIETTTPILSMHRVTGNVGIGTAAPGGILDIKTGTTRYIQFTNEYGINRVTGDYVLGMFIDGSNISHIQSYLIGTGGKVLAINAGGGNVGIGTANPNYKLDVNGTINASSNIIGGTYLQIGNAYFGKGDQLITGGGGSDAAMVANGNSNLLFGTNSLERMRIDGSGNVGIGTTAPGYTLDVNGTIRAVGHIRFDSGIRDNRDNTIIAQSISTLISNRTLTIGNATYSNIVFPNGNVGIGQSTATSKLDVYHSGNGMSTLVNSYLSYGTGVSGNYVANQFTAIYDTGSTGAITGLRIDTTNLGSGNTYGLLVNGGNVGIGTVVPNYKLDVSGSNNVLRISSTTAVSYFQIQNVNSGYNNDSDGLTIGLNTGDAYIHYREAGNMILSTSNTERVRITSAGNFGINSNAPVAKLDVRGDALFAGVSRTSKTVAGTDSSAEFENGISIFKGTNNVGWLLSSDSSNHFGLYNWNANGFVFRIENSAPVGSFHIKNNGNIGIGTTSPSDKLQVLGSVFAGKDLSVAFSGSTPNIAQFKAYDTANVNRILAIGYSSNLDAGFIQGNDIGVSWKNVLINPLGGDVLIGTTTASSGWKLLVNGNVKSVGDIWATARLISGINQAALFTSNSSYVAYIGGHNDLVFSTNFLNVGEVAGEKMRLKENGNFLIGSTSDTGQKLQVAGQIKVGTDSGIVGYSSVAGKSAYINVADQYGNMHINASSAYGMYLDSPEFYFRNAASSVLIYISTSGNVGIGGTGPAYKLDVTGIMRANGTGIAPSIVQSSGTASLTNYIAAGDAGVFAGNNSGGFYMYTNSLVRAYISSAGYAQFNGGMGVSGNISTSVGSNVYGFSALNTASTNPTYAWNIGKGWTGNYDESLLFNYNGSIKGLLDSSGGFTSFGAGFKVNNSISQTVLGLSPLGHGNSYVGFETPASGIPGNNLHLVGWDGIRFKATTGDFVFRDGSNNNIAILKQNGNLGLGVISPDVRLDVNGTIRSNAYLLGAYDIIKTNGSVQIVQNNVHNSHLSMPSLSEAAIEKSYMNNNTQFKTPYAVEVWNGSAWVAHSDGPTSQAIKNMLMGRSVGGTTIPYNTSKFRIIFEAGNYCNLNWLYMYHSTSGHTMQVRILRSSGLDINTTTEISNNSGISSWPGHTSIAHTDIWWHPTASDPGYSKYVIIEITPTWNATYSANGITLNSINWYGSYPASSQNQVWYWNNDRTVNFLSSVTANGSVTGANLVSSTVVNAGTSVSAGTSISAGTKVISPFFADSTEYNINLGGPDGRGLAAGYSGGNYGGIGYNIKHNSNGSYTAPGTDTSTYLRFDSGLTAYYAGTGAGNRTLSLAQIMRLDSGSNLTVTGTMYASGGNSTNWNSAFGWGNHAGLYATKQTGRTSTDANDILSTGFYNGEGTPANWPVGYGQIIMARGTDTGLQIAGGYSSDSLYFRGYGYGSNGGFHPWRTILHSNNFNSYSPTLAGVGATGTWGISISGNALTATSATTATTATNVAWSGITSKPTTIAGYGITDSLVYASSSYSDPSWVTSLGGTKITGNISGQASAVNGTTGQLLRKDDRIIEPNSITASYMQFGFTSWNNDGGNPYADYLHLRSYNDGSGGNDNLVMFRKDAIGMRIWQQSWGSASAYSTYKDVAFTDHSVFLGTTAVALNRASGALTLAGVTVSSANALSTLSATQTITGTGAGNFDFTNGTGAGWYFNWIQNGSTAMKLTTSNNLLIGTTTDLGEKLQVNGSILAGNTTISGASLSAIRVAAANSSYSGRSIAIQQTTSEGDTRLFADYEPYVNYGIYVRNSDDTIHFTGGTNTGALENWTEYNRTGTSMTSYSKVKISLDSGNVTVGGSLTSSGIITATGGNSTNWNSAFGWGNHASYDYFRYDRMTAQRAVASNTTVDLNTQLEDGGTYASYGASGAIWNAPFAYGAAMAFSFAATIKAQFAFDIRHGYTDFGDLFYRTKNSTGYAVWRKMLHDGNFNLYSPTMSGSGATGTWGISITGNAATATNVAWSGITSKPTTVAGFGIADFAVSAAGGSISPDNTTINGLYYGGISLLGQSDGAFYVQGYSSAWAHQIFGDYRTGQIAVRGKNSNSWQSWRIILDSSNYTNYTHTFASLTSKPTTLSGYGITDALSLAGGTVTGIIRSSYNTASGLNNLAFNTAKTVIGNYHIQNGDGSGNTDNKQAAITFQGGNANEAQAGIYVLNNNGDGTSMGFATTHSYATGPQIFMSASNMGVVNFTRATPTVSGQLILHSGNYTSYSPSLVGGGASGTWGINITGSAPWSGITSKPTTVSGYGITDMSTQSVSYAATAGNSTLFNGKSLGKVMNYQSNSDFPDGTLIVTSIDASVSSGDSFVLELSGKSYSSSPPFKLSAQGYIYSDTFINTSAISYGNNFTATIKILNYGGYLAFWFARMGYWHSFDVHVRSANSVDGNENKVTGIINSVEPTAAKKVTVNVAQAWNSTHFANNSANWNTAFGWGNHTGLYLPLAGGTVTGATVLPGNSATSTTIGGVVFQYGYMYHGNSYFLTSGSDYSIYARAGGKLTLGANDNSVIVLNTDRSVTLPAGKLIMSGFDVENTGDIKVANYGNQLIGVYSSTVYQGIFAMGSSYKLPANGLTATGFYGLAWSHTNMGGQTKSGLSHQLLVMENGSTTTAIGSGIWTNGLITTVSNGTSANWKSAFDWGNHASAGYLAASVIGSQVVLGLSGDYVGTISDLNTSYSAGNSGLANDLRIFRYNNGAGNSPGTGTDNANWVMNIHSHSGLYGTQISSNNQGYLYIRKISAGAFTGWKTVIDSDNIVNQSVNYANSAGAVAWGNITSKPTTIAGYGITDAITTANIGNQSVTYAVISDRLISGTTTNLNSTFLSNTNLNNALQILRFDSGASNSPATIVNNSNWVMNIYSNSGYSGHQLSAIDSEDIYFRRISGGSFNTWRKLLHTGNFTDNSSNWNAAFAWGNHASANYQVRQSSVSTAFASISTTYTTTSSNHTIKCDGTFTVTLVTASGNSGLVQVIKNAGAGIITVQGSSSQTIDGSTSVNLMPGDSLMVQSDSNNWMII